MPAGPGRVQGQGLPAQWAARAGGPAASRARALCGDVAGCHARRMSDTPEDHAHAVAAALGLTLTPEQLPGVVMNLAVAARAARLVEAVPLLPADEPAPVFVPLRPSGR